jgi:hypothetical protein
MAALIAGLIGCGGRDISGPTTPGPDFITNGVPTGTSFGSVGAHLFDFDGDGTIDAFNCSGSLIAPRVFLLAAHCVSAPGLAGECFFPASQHYVTFAPAIFPNLPPPDAIIRAEECHADPAFQPLKATDTDAHDLAVLILPAGSTAGKTPYQLPPAGWLDQLAAHGGLVGQLFVNVGYGVDATLRGPPSILLGTDGVRRTSKSRFLHLYHHWLLLLMNANATGEGGTCFIDSGSPHFLDGNLGVVVAVKSWGDRHCRTFGGSYRLDTPSARAFLGQFVSLP